jgi:hypothetical protein
LPVPETARYSVVALDGAAGLEKYTSAWDGLAAAAAEPNVFYEPWMLLPAVRAFGGGLDLQFVLVFASDAERPQVPPLLCGLFPLERAPRYRLFPVSVLRLWQHLYCFLCTPLLRAGYAAGALAAFFHWAATSRRGAALVELPLVSGEGPFHQALVEDFHDRAPLALVTESYTRALLVPRGDAQAYLTAALATKRRKELRRQEKRLAEAGRLEYVTLGPDGNVAEWVEAFLGLEASGWKGKEGTALALRGPDRAFFQEVAAAAFQRNRLMMLGMYLDGRPIALKCNFLAGPGSFAFKIAFDENYARYSPGVHLEMANVEQVHRRAEIRWMDSCAAAGHFMINRLWLDRRAVQTVLVSTGRRGGDLTVALLPLLRWLKRRLFRRRPPGGAASSSPSP